MPRRSSSPKWITSASSFWPWSSISTLPVAIPRRVVLLKATQSARSERPGCTMRTLPRAVYTSRARSYEIESAVMSHARGGGSSGSGAEAAPSAAKKESAAPTHVRNARLERASTAPGAAIRPVAAAR